jgi:hypothetical protein
MEDSNKQSSEPKWESPLKKLWDILMFRKLVLPTLLKMLNLLALLSALYMTVIYIPCKLFAAMPIIWMYVIAIRIASELVLLGYDFLIQRTLNK